jgi:hypothetical protein
LNKKAPEEVIVFIVDTIQPYIGGYGQSIHYLHRLDIEDKHRLLIAKAELNFINGISIEDDAGVERAFDTWLVRDDRIASHLIKGNRNTKVKNQGQPSYRILFSDDQPFGFLPVIPTLRNLADLIEATIYEIKLTFLVSQLGL